MSLYHQISNAPTQTAPLSGEDQRLTLAFENLDHMPSSLINGLTRSVKILDLSHNCFSNLCFLKHFSSLTSLILDHNRVNSASTFPTNPHLRILWLNHNHIDQLFPFIQRLKVAFPNLEFLSLMANEAVPMNVDESTFYQYLQYRLFVISWFPTLKHLDDQEVTEAERMEANRLYKRPLLERMVDHNSVSRVIDSINAAFSLLCSKENDSHMKPLFI